MTSVQPRMVRAADLRHLAAVEADADRSYVELFGDLSWESPTPGHDRDAEPGFLLVAGTPPVGFAHVLEVDGEAHLQQLAVRRAHQRGGVGTSLVEAAAAEARARGYRRLTLSTYRDVPWNGPWYARLGFTELTRPGWFHDEVRRTEQRMGLERHGPRVLMVRALRD